MNWCNSRDNCYFCSQLQFTQDYAIEAWKRQMIHEQGLPWLKSGLRMSLLSSSGRKKAGQPHPDSYLHSDENNSWPQTIQAYIPFSFNFRYSPEKGLWIITKMAIVSQFLSQDSNKTYLSVAASWVTRYWIGVNFFLSSFLSTLMAGDAVFLKDQNFLLILSCVTISCKLRLRYSEEVKVLRILH